MFQDHFPGIQILQRSIVCVACLFVFACNTQTKGPVHPAIAESKKIIQPGDILVRAGTSYASQNIRELSLSDKSYSHAGIVVKENDELKVCSIEPIDETSTTDRIRYEPVEKFLEPSHNSSFAVYRYQLSPSENADLLSRIETYYKKGIVFDPVFIYDTDNEMYCSEMISKALDSATKGRIQLKRSYITSRSAINSLVRHFKKYKLTPDQIKERPVVLIDNVYMHPACSLVKKFELN